MAKTKLSPKGVKQAKEKMAILGKSEEGFSGLLGISRNTLRKFLEGEEPILERNFIRICKELELDWEEVSEKTDSNLIGQKDYSSNTQDIKPSKEYVNPTLSSPHTQRFKYLLEEKTEGFVGRGFVFDAFNNFISSNDRGYFTVVGDPGEGKSSIAARYATNYPCLYYFNVRSDGQDTAAQFLENICQQLIEHFSLDLPSYSGFTANGDYLKEILHQVSNVHLQQEKLVIVVDALDEVDLESQKPRPNILYLPKHLPQNIYFFLTRRRDQRLVSRLRFETPEKVFDLLDYVAKTTEDVRAYIHSFLHDNVKYRDKLKVWIGKRQDLDIEEFVKKLSDKSERNFMYLRYVLPQIANGFYQDLSLEQLPQGLMRYYEDHWERMGMNASPRPKIKIDVIYILTEIRQPISRQLISEFSSTISYKVKESDVQEVLDDWEQFLRRLTIDSTTCFKVYHLSFNDFLHRKDIIEAAGVEIAGIHGMITNTLMEDLEDEDDDEDE